MDIREFMKSKDINGINFGFYYEDKMIKSIQYLIVRKDSGWTECNFSYSDEMVRKIIKEIPMLYDIPNDTVLDVTLRMNEEEIDVEVNFNQRIIEENNIIELDEKSLKFVKDNIKDIVGNNHRIIVYYSKDCAVEPWLKEKIENRILSLIRTKVDLLTKGYIGAITPTVLLASVHDRYLCFKYDYVVSYQKTCKLNY